MSKIFEVFFVLPENDVHEKPLSVHVFPSSLFSLLPRVLRTLITSVQADVHIFLTKFFVLLTPVIFSI